MLIPVVNKKGETLRFEDKEKCHDGNGILHRAFTLLIFDDRGRLLIQKRSHEKRLWPLIWETSGSSHPGKDEDMVQAGEQRLKKEMGFHCDLRHINDFFYHTRYKDLGAEREYCATLIGTYNGPIKHDPREVAMWKWIEIPQLERDIKTRPHLYAPWLQLAIDATRNDQQHLQTLLAELTRRVEPMIDTLLTSHVDRKHREIMRYQTQSGGKRLRPTLAIAGCKMLGGSFNDVMPVAAGLEILHNYTLMLDDIIDHSTIRRGRPTLWKQFGPSITQSIAMGYPAAIYEGATRSKHAVKIADLYAKALKTIADGEIMDILFEQFGRANEPYVNRHRYHTIKEQDYNTMIAKKTASLLAASCAAGAIAAGATTHEINTLEQFGHHLGIAFQIQDDILDIFGDEKKFGKKIGKDIIERKLGNIVILLAMAELKPDAKKKLRSILKKSNISYTDVKSALNLIKTTRAYVNARKKAVLAVRTAKSHLDQIQAKNPWHTYMNQLTDFVIDREI